MTQHQIRLRMPWKASIYSICSDEFVRCRPVFVMAWGRMPCLGGFKFRCGWTGDFQ